MILTTPCDFRRILVKEFRLRLALSRVEMSRSQMPVMNRIIPLALLAILLSSCFSVSFIEPQPKGGKNISSFPDKIVGTYLLYGDTIIVTPKSFTFEGGTHYISDSIIVRKFKKYKVLSVKEKNGWTITLVERRRNGDLSIYSINDEDFEGGRHCRRDSLLKVMGTICQVKKKNSKYTANPSKKEFKKLIKKKIFRPAGDLKKIE